MASIVPVAKALFLCDSVAASADGKVDLFGVFATIRPSAGYPHVLSRINLFARLSGGLGDVSVWVDIRKAATHELIRTTTPRRLTFPTRDVLVNYSFRLDQFRFEEPGLYLAELYCNNEWVCDTKFHLLDWEGEP